MGGRAEVLTGPSRTGVAVGRGCGEYRHMHHVSRAEAAGCTGNCGLPRHDVVCVIRLASSSTTARHTKHTRRPGPRKQGPTQERGAKAQGASIAATASFCGVQHGGGWKAAGEVEWEWCRQEVTAQHITRREERIMCQGTASGIDSLLNASRLTSRTRQRAGHERHRGDRQGRGRAAKAACT